MSGDADGADARATTAMWNAERLVQVQVTDISADVARTRQADHRVHVRTVEVDLAAALVHDAAHIADRRLEHAVRRRIRHHQRGQLVAIRFRFGLEVGHVDVAALVGLDDDHFHAGHDGAGRIGTVRGLRDQAHVAMRVAA